jgi:hypothetical protein
MFLRLSLNCSGTLLETYAWPFDTGGDWLNESLPPASENLAGLGLHGNGQQASVRHFASPIVRTYLDLTTTSAAENVFREAVPLGDTGKRRAT